MVAGRLANFGFAILISLIAAALALTVGDLSTKALSLTIGVLFLLPLAAVTRLTKPLLLIAWIFSLTYFRVVYPIDSLAGFQGFYVTAADGVFLLLLAFWFYEAAQARRLTVSFPFRLDSGMTVYVLPLVLVCFISALLAARNDWSMYEVIRVAKIPIFLLYCRHNIGKREFWICLAALGLSIVVQTALGALQLRGLLGNYVQEAWVPEPRPNGTLAHASIFSGYLILLMPVFEILAVTLRKTIWRIASAAAVAAGLVGIALTQSRIPWALAIVELATVAVFLVALKIVEAKRALTVLGTGGVFVGLALIPLVSRIETRLTSDFDTAVSWRLKMNDVGFEIFKGAPFFGIGLANFPLYLRNSDIEFADSLDDAFNGIYNRPGTEAAPEKGFHWVWVPHNIYILLLAETGSFGLSAFLFFVVMALRAGVRAIKLADPVHVGAAVGLFIGICAVLIENLGDWAIWLDPILYTWALAIAMLRNVPDLSRPRATTRFAESSPYSLASSSQNPVQAIR